MKLQIIIGQLLRWGVFSSIFVAFVGGVIYLLRHGSEPVTYHTFAGVPEYVHPSNIFASIMDGRGRAVIQAGIIMLISTPIVRIIFSVIGFATERDYLYSFITLVVLSVIITSMLSGNAG
jgi:uncharacterized membrane protein